MPTVRSTLDAFVGLLSAGRSLEAIERFYDDEVVVFENRELARAGRSACVTFEREQLDRLSGPPRFKLLKSAVDERAGHAFLEYVLRFVGPDGRPQRIEEVAVQRWSNGRITEERFYYEGIVDEGEALPNE